MTSASDSKSSSTDASQANGSTKKTQEQMKVYQEELYAYTLAKLNQAKDESKKPNAAAKAYLLGTDGNDTLTKKSK